MLAFEEPSFPLAEAGERLGPRPLESVLHRGAVVRIGAFRASLGSVAEAGTDLTRVAFDLGYSSHSHFTAAFGEGFATTPSEWRRRAHRSAAVDLASRLEPRPWRR